MFGKKQHSRIPQILNIQKEVDELGGKSWIFLPEEFDKVFCGVYCFRNPDKKIWGVVQVGSEWVKVYRGSK
jgi:hypothetical protein